MGFIDMKDLTPGKAIVKQQSNVNEVWDFLRNQGRIDLNKPREIPPGSWVHNYWKGEPCYVVAAGGSLNGFDYSNLDGRHTIGINHMIEKYDNFEWFIFLDQRFIELTTYDLQKYKGHIFAQNTTELNPGENITLFKCKNDSISKDFEDGLFKSALTGLVALNLAILSGASPIYLLGFDCGGVHDSDNHHHIDGYTGELQDKTKLKKYQRTAYFFDNFAYWKDKIINLSEQSNIKTFEKRSWESHFLKPDIKVQGRQPRIAHLSFTGDVTFMGDISRHVIRSCYGRHSLHNISDPTPEADLYILEHFISTKKQIDAFAYKNKAIDLVHTMNCYPQGNLKKVIALTETWKKKLAEKGIESEVIHGGIDIDEYIDRAVYDTLTFGRITRWSEGKIHPEWNRVVKEILDEMPDAKCLMYVQFLRTSGRPPLYHDRVEYNESVHIFEYKGQYLKNMSVYVHANHTFQEICSHALIEAMATGLPIVLLYEESSAEVLGNAGILCNTIDEVKEITLKVLQDREMWEEYSKKSLERARFFSHVKMIENWDRVIKECLK